MAQECSVDDKSTSSHPDIIRRKRSNSMDDSSSIAAIAARYNRFYDDPLVIAASVSRCNRFYKVPSDIKFIEDKWKEVVISGGPFLMYKNGNLTMFYKDYIQDSLKEGWFCALCGLESYYCPHATQHKQISADIEQWMDDYEKWLNEEFTKYAKGQVEHFDRLEYLASEMSRLQKERTRLFGLKEETK